MNTPIGQGFRGPDGHLGFLLRQAQHAMRNAIDRELRPLELTGPQFSLLGILHAEPGISGAEAARDGMLTAQTTNEVIVALERRALVERRPHPRDRRMRQVFLTPEGEAAFAAAAGRVRTLERRAASGLTPDEAGRLKAWLVTCAQALEDPGDQRSSG
jgi:DNA-binding MarR family transcriptional regulator